MKKNAMLILLMCGLFLFYKYIAQLYPSLISTELMKNYGYSGLMLALMASSYYYSYTFMQILAGFIVDRFSIKIPMFFAILSISVMILLFTHVKNYYLLCFSRIIMGVGASFATVIYMKSAAEYTSAKTFGIVSSLLATATMLGAACGGAPIAIFFQSIGWRHGLNFIAILGLMLAFAVLLFKKIDFHVKNKPVTNINNLKKVFINKKNWYLLLYSGLTFSPIAILGGLWGTPFLMAKYSFNTTTASFFISTMFLGHAFGSPMWALLSRKSGKKIELMYLANIMSALILSSIIYINFNYYISLLEFFFFGFSVSCFMLSFELCREINPLHAMALSVAFINSGEGIIGSIIEPLIGKILDISKNGDAFTLVNYQSALILLPICFILSSIVLTPFKGVNTKLSIKIQNYARI